MDTLATMRGVTKRYKDFTALDRVDLDIQPGRITGLIGPNGAGKTTLLKCLLGLATYDGEIRVLGRDPLRDRTEVLRDVCFIADTAILPRWIRVRNCLDYIEAVHPRFNRELAERFLRTTKINPGHQVQTLSKGMITQLHLALVMAIDARLLVLDEPTLGLDILYRKEFYNRLLEDYFDHERTILVTTHQVEEIEALLTDLIFIREGRLILNHSMEDFQELYMELEALPDRIEAARELRPISEKSSLGSRVFIFEGRTRDQLETLGRVRTPSIADLFVAKMQNGGEAA